MMLLDIDQIGDSRRVAPSNARSPTTWSGSFRVEKEGITFELFKQIILHFNIVCKPSDESRQEN